MTQVIIEVSVRTRPITMVHTHLMTANLDHDMETDLDTNFILKYPGPAGQPVCAARTVFVCTHQANNQANQIPWAPFADKDEWEFRQWMLQTLGHHEMDKLLTMNFVHSYPKFQQHIV